MNDTDLYHLRSFEDLIYDAVHLLYLAHDIDREPDKDGYEFTYTRTSIHEGPRKRPGEKRETPKTKRQKQIPRFASGRQGRVTGNSTYAGKTGVLLRRQTWRSTLLLARLSGYASIYRDIRRGKFSP